MAQRNSISPGAATANATSFQKGQVVKARKPGSGRKKGDVNRVTRSVKEALVEAFDKLGGVPALVRWGRANPTDFYKLWLRLLPIQVTGLDGGPIKVEHKHDLSQLSTEELCQLAEMVEKTAIMKAMAGQQTKGVTIRLKQALADRLQVSSEVIDGETVAE